MASNDRSQHETLHLWHCPECGYANPAFDPCLGCHRRAPRRVRANTKAYLESRGERPTQQ